MGIQWKIWRSEGRIHKKTIKRKDCVKMGAWTVCIFKWGLSRKREWQFLRGGVDTQRILCFLTKGERKAFLGESKKGSHVVRLPLRAHGCHKRRKNLSFYEIWRNPTPPLFFIFYLFFLVTLFRIGLFISSLTYGS